MSLPLSRDGAATNASTSPRPSDPSLRSGQAKEGNRKTLDPFLDWIPDQGRGQALRMTEKEAGMTGVVMQSRVVLQEGP